MAEQITAALAVDANGNGVSDLLEKVLGSQAFAGSSNDNWRNRRLLVVATVVIMLLVTLMVAVTWMISTLSGQKIDANNADLGSAMFWGAGATIGGGLSAYLGVATWDHASQRRASITAAEKIGQRAAQQNAGASPYPPAPAPSPYGAQNGPYAAPAGSPYNFDAPAPAYPPNTSEATDPNQMNLPLGQPGDPPGGF